MAIRQDTRLFAAECFTGNIADASLTNLNQFTVYIPETVTAFRSAFLEVGYQDAITATGGTVTEHRVALRLGAAGYTTFTETDDLASSGENMAALMGPIDFTSHFTTNWTGTSMTCDVQVYFDFTTGTTLIARNVTAVLVVTFEYDDDSGVNATQGKTVMIPMESRVGALPTAANSNFGTNQIPILTGGGSPFLPEPGVVIRDYFFLIEGNEASNGASTDWTLSANIDNGTAYSFGVQESALGSDRFCRWLWKPSAVPDTTAAHQFQLWSSTARLNHAVVTLVVTYDFTMSGLSRWLVSVMLPVEIASPLGISTTGDASRFKRELLVQDPGTITLRQSGFRMNFNTTASISGLAFRAGSQAFRGYTHITSVACGMFSLQQRVDSGSAQGAGLSLDRGLNYIVLDGYATDTTDQATNVNGYVVLNYECDVGPAGRGQNTHTVRHLLAPWNAQLLDRVRVNNWALPIPDSDTWFTSIGFQLYQLLLTAANAITLDVECLSGEGKGGGYYDIYADAYQSDNERACSLTWARGRDVFKRHPEDPDPERLDVTIARDYRFYSATTTALGMAVMITYHAFSYTVAGTLSGYSGDGSGVIVDVHRSDTDEKVLSLTSTTGGAFSGNWHDNTVPVFCVARQDATHAGRSDDSLAT